MNTKKPLVYYVRRQDPATGKAMKGVSPVATVAIMQEGSLTARGIAICSQGEGAGKGDNWCRSMGRGKAVARCRKAFGELKSALPIGKPIKIEDSVETLRWSGMVLLDIWLQCYGQLTTPEFKSQFNPDLTDFERRLIQKEAERNAPKVTAAAGV